LTTSFSSDGIIALPPARDGASWRWWRVANGALSDLQTGVIPAVTSLDRVTVLAPASLAPVRDKPMPALAVPQALAAARLEQAGEALHVAAAVAGDRLLTCRVRRENMDHWLDLCAQAGFDPTTIIPTGLVLPSPETGTILADIAGNPVARTADAAFAGESPLLDALGSGAVPRILDSSALESALLATHAAPALDLQQGAYAPRRAGFFRRADWAQLARMAATVALLALALMLVWIFKLNAAASDAEARAVRLVQKRFPSTSDFDSAERVLGVEMARRGAGGRAFPAVTAALLGAMRTVPGIGLRDLGYSADGALRATLAARRAEDINIVLLSLQHDGWQLTVPPALVQDSTGATVTAVTLRAP
jgi:general secretion pathway protein L